MTIDYDDRPCGAGKTYSELLNMTQTRGLYLLAVDRVQAMRERVATIIELGEKAGKRPRVITIESAEHDEIDQQGTVCAIKTQAVTTEVQALPKMYASGHVIAVISHEALKRSDLADFSGWKLVVDETPSIFDQQRIKSRLTRDFFAKHYELVPSGTRSILRATSKATAADFRRDSLAEVLTVMHARVLSDRITVLTNLTSWDDLSPDKDWVWWSIWSPEQLEAFDRVVVLANAFTRSHTYALMCRFWPEIEWRRVTRPATLAYRPRTMTIRYYAEAHRASRALFSSELGKRWLALIAENIARHVDAAKHIWTCNLKDLPALRGPLGSSTRLSPRQAGSNDYAAMTSATIVYTAKPDPEERGLMRDFSIDPMVVTETREFETLYQFASRISVRDPRSETPTTVYVYDRAQAEYLALMFGETGYVTCALELVDLGFAHTSRSGRSGPRPRERSIQEVAEAAEQTRIAARERKRRQRERQATHRTPSMQ